jgi:hemerythrin-like domain-containing protein
MDLVECLLKDHQHLRSLTAAMSELVRGVEPSDTEQLGQANRAMLTEVSARFLSDLKAHEALEEQFLIAVLRDMGDAGRPLVRRIESDHGSLHEIFKILDALVSLAHDENAYSIKFTLINLSAQLERHLEREEREAFPLLKGTLSFEQLEALGARAVKYSKKLPTGEGKP